MQTSTVDAVVSNEADTTTQQSQARLIPAIPFVTLTSELQGAKDLIPSISLRV
ncbi:MAG: hypothetical protein IH840_16670 [Candidatus Heimdallarchaeota archaeon]|nr:hypothetical protein [Candidatus Heimdallarchaeota archaeon]